MSSTEIVNQDAAIERLNQRLGELKTKSEIEIKDMQSFVASAEVKLDLESYIKSVEAHFEPELAPLEEKVKRIKLTKTGLLIAKQWLVGLVNRQREFTAEEKRKAELERQREQARIVAEQRAKAEAERKEAERIAAEDRKKREAEIAAAQKAGEVKAREAERLRKEAAAEEARQKELAAKQAAETAANAPTVTVATNLPKVAGIKNQTFYYAELTDWAALLSAYEMSILAHTPERTMFLRRFIQANEQEIGKYARDTKDPKAVMAALPGVWAWSKG